MNYSSGKFRQKYIAGKKSDAGVFLVGRLLRLQLEPHRSPENRTRDVKVSGVIISLRSKSTLSLTSLVE